MALTASACGGQSVRHGAGKNDDDNGGRGGSTGSTGASGGAGGSAGAPSTAGTAGKPVETCGERYGRSVEPGDSWIDRDACETCQCLATDDGGGRLVCLPRCDVSCEKDGVTYTSGYAHLDDNDCSTCVCTEEGWVCDSKDCLSSPDCRELARRYGAAKEEARVCDPGDENACATHRVSALPCGCDIAVGDSATLDPILMEWEGLGCGAEPVDCPEHCLPYIVESCTNGRCDSY